MHYSEEIPQTQHIFCSVLIPKKTGNSWEIPEENPRVGPKQKALGAPRSHLQPSAWEDLEDVRYRWHVPPSRSGWFHGIPMGFQLRQFTADRIICVISHGHKTGENSALFAWWISRKLFRFLLDLRNLKKLQASFPWFWSTILFIHPHVARTFFLEAFWRNASVQKGTHPQRRDFPVGEQQAQALGRFGAPLLPIPRFALPCFSHWSKCFVAKLWWPSMGRRWRDLSTGKQRYL